MSEATPARSTASSKDLFNAAQEHLAGGVGSGTRSPRSGWTPYPIFVDSARGSHVLDVDGNDYIDYAMGLGPMLLGHRPPEVIEAVTNVINERGSLFALAHDLEAKAADAVSARVPSIEMLRFGSSGTECVSYALRFARAFTGRKLIVRFEGAYHGWADGIHWSAHPALADAGPIDRPNVIPDSSGIPDELGLSLLVVPWNNPEALKAIFTEYGDEIAAVITEPIMGNSGGLLPQPGFLELMRELTTASGSLLIFDEVLVGFRVGPAGAQGLLGVTPDLTVLAKALGGGFPVAAVGGRRDVMELVASGGVQHGGTYNSSPMACAAAIAAIEVMGRDGFYEEMMARGERLANGLVDVAAEAGIESCWTGVGSLFQLWLGSSEPPTDYRSAQALVATSPFTTFRNEMLERRVIIQPPQEGLFLISAAHSDEDVNLTLEAAADVMPAVAAAIAAGEVGPGGGVR